MFNGYFDIAMVEQDLQAESKPERRGHLPALLGSGAILVLIFVWRRRVRAA